MAIGKIPAQSISSSISQNQVASGNSGLRNINGDAKTSFSDIASKIENSIAPDKALTAGDLGKLLEGSGLSSELQKSIVGLAPSTQNIDKAVDAQAQKAAAASHAQFAFNLPGQGRQEQAKEQNQDFLKNLSGNDWMNTGASLT
jgi:hypothetical protein